jgi:hypothetical protein
MNEETIEGQPTPEIKKDKEPKYSWQSERYLEYSVFKKILFLFGAIWWFVGIFWIVRLFSYLWLKNLPLKYRLCVYASQTVFFGWITLFIIIIKTFGLLFG